ncbi:MAG: phage portal protein [Frankiales bacterium]|nr:phage portal protein [Frankiales bacterium]
MALSPKDAVDVAAQILNDHARRERARLDRIAIALNPKIAYGLYQPPKSPADALDVDLPPAVQLPEGVSPALRNLARKARTNYLPRILNEFVQTLKIDGYRAKGGTDNAPPWTYGWQANKLDGRQGGIYRAALAYGVSYGTVTQGTDEATGAPAPVMRGVSPRKMTAVYGDPVEDDWPMYALKHDDPLMRLYDGDQIYFIGKQGPAAATSQDLQFIEPRAHGLDVCPVVRFRPEMLLDEVDETGIIEPLIALQARVDETVFGMLVAQFFAAFRQRYVIGWVPETEEETLAASASTLWTFKDGPNDVDVGSLTETDLTRYINSKESGVTDMATISQMPQQYLGIGAVANLSAEALAALEAGKNRRSEQFETSMGESMEQFLRLGAKVVGDTASANDVSAQVRWKDSTARSFAQMVDGLGKMVTMLGVPPRAAWPMIPGVTDQDLDTWAKMAEEGDSLAALTKLIDEQAAAGKAPSAGEVTAFITQSSADKPGGPVEQ